MASLAYRLFIPLYVAFLVWRSSVSENAEDPSLFPGHLEPLGAKNNKSSIKTLFAFPEPRDFFENFASANLPVLIKTGAKLSPAFVKWTDEYFLNLLEAENFEIEAEEGKKENRTRGDLRSVSFKEFVETYKDKDVYMVNGVPTFIQ